MPADSNKHHKFSNFIAGSWVPPSRERYLTLECGAGSTLMPSSCDIDIDHALQAAHNASHDWLELSVTQRVAYLTELAHLTRIFQGLQGNCASPTCGASIWNSNANTLGRARQHLLNPKPTFLLRESSKGANHQIVVGKLLLDGGEDISGAFRRIAPALASGFTLVVALLHRPRQPLCLQILSFMEYAAHSLPPGILNLVYGLGVEAGVPLCNSNRAVPIGNFALQRNTRAQSKLKAQSCQSER